MTVRKPDILRNVIVRDMLHSIKPTNFSLLYYIFITVKCLWGRMKGLPWPDKISSRTGFIPRAVIWRPRLTRTHLYLYNVSWNTRERLSLSSSIPAGASVLNQLSDKFIFILEDIIVLKTFCSTAIRTWKKNNYATTWFALVVKIDFGNILGCKIFFARKLQKKRKITWLFHNKSVFEISLDFMLTNNWILFKRIYKDW